MSDLPQLSGPFYKPASGSDPKQLVVLAHGYGANGQDLIALANEWSAALPDAAFVAPNAPEEVPGFPMGRQWFPIASMSRAELAEGVRGAAPVLEAFILAAMADLNIAPEGLAMVGFSQGTMMSLQVGLASRVKPACIIGYSGAVGDPEGLGPQISHRPPVLLVHGAADDMVPVSAMDATEQFLMQNRIQVESHISPNLGHSIDNAGITLGRKFLVQHLTGATADPAE